MRKRYKAVVYDGVAVRNEGFGHTVISRLDQMWTTPFVAPVEIRRQSPRNCRVTQTCASFVCKS